MRGCLDIDITSRLTESVKRVMDTTPVTASHPGAGSKPQLPMVKIINNQYRCTPCVEFFNTRSLLDVHLTETEHAANVIRFGPYKSIAIPELPTALLPIPTPAGRKRKNIATQGNSHCDTCASDLLQVAVLDLFRPLMSFDIPGLSVILPGLYVSCFSSSVVKS